jgi:hypothetical protein
MADGKIQRSWGSEMPLKRAQTSGISDEESLRCGLLPVEETQPPGGNPRPSSIVFGVCQPFHSQWTGIAKTGLRPFVEIRKVSVAASASAASK